MNQSTLPRPSELLAQMRATPPLVHCITNYVAMNVAANTLLAAGAAPAMVHAPEESGEFVAIAGALTINIGTLSEAWVRGMIAAAEGANAAGKPWVLDPVAHFATSYRRETVATLVALKPSVIRGNASELMALAGEESAGRGVDAGDPVAAAEGAARRLATETGAVIAVSGETDFVTDGTRAARVTGGAAIMPQVTALGCSLTTLIGAYCATAPDAFSAAVAAQAHFAATGERAAQGAQGPGSFAVAFLDQLAAVSAENIDDSRVSAA